VFKRMIIARVAMLALSQGRARGDGMFSDELICPGILIRAAVASVDPPSKGAIVHMRVAEVYAGPSNLVGQMFTLKSWDEDKSQPSRSSPAAGDEGVLIMRLQRGNLVPNPAHSTLGMVQLPVMKRDAGESYASTIAWAERVRIVYAASDLLRSDLLQKAAFDAQPQLSAWAMEALGGAWGRESPGRLDALVAESQLPLVAQVVLDKHLCTARSKIWLDSPVRLRMINGWVKSTRIADAAQMRFVANRIVQATAARQLNGPGLLRLVQMATNNQTIPDAIKQTYVLLLPAVRAEIGASNEAFELLTRQISGASSEELSLAAATALRDTCTLDGTRRAALEYCLRDVKSPKVAAIVKQAIAAPER
jgi:hypothetical protein